MSFDCVIIGSGAGGGTMARELATTGRKILIVERGDFIPQEDHNWNPASVWKDLRYRTTETWLDERGREFRPYTHYCVGGNTKFWGTVMYRLRPQDFKETAHVDGHSPAWPIDYETLAPYYERAERMYEVHGQAGADPTEGPRNPYPFPPVPHATLVGGIVRDLERQGLHPSPLPLALRENCIYCNACNSFACKIHAKGDAEVCGVRPAIARPNVTLWVNATARRLVTDASGKRVEAIEIDRSGTRETVSAPLVIVCCGAVNSAALLLRSATERHPRGLANSSGQVGKRYMAHLATMLQGFHPFRVNDTVFQKTVAINDFYFKGRRVNYPLGQIQSQGRTHGVMAQAAQRDFLARFGPLMARIPEVPVWAFDAWVARGVDWLAMTEDLPREDNKVTIEPDGRIRLHYTPNNLEAHRELVNETKRILQELGFWIVMTHSHKAKNTTHQCGTLVFGTDPNRSVLDIYCKTHDVDNLYVVDASFFPSSAAVNPGLTIAAQAIRVADHLKATRLS
ncbi:MAG TPA: GMC family oxidoreductase [Vicinamibacterales bacterium]|nr:GMC family oxidoreductase [Vicinamibacterales bacterium]